MRMSKMHFKTLREVPAEAEIPSHILLTRAAMIRKLVSGVYGFMPLGWRTLRKIEEIVREEMDATGSQEILMSALQPAELWQESGRWYEYGPEMFRLKDRNNREFCLGPTHEEVFTDIIRAEVDSYRQLPRNLYQIQHKYRDEARPRFGVMRSREFIMKDAYSFDLDEAGLDKSYDDMYAAYEKVFDRCGLTYRAVEADSGAMGGNNTHEFTALSEVGESEIAYCDHCEMAATSERADCVDVVEEQEDLLPMEEVHTPGTTTIDAVCEYLSLPKGKSIKALLLETYDEDGKVKDYVAAFVRGDRELNMTKLGHALGVPEHALAFADEEQMSQVTGCVGGFTGPVGLHDCIIVVDSELTTHYNLCAGACKTDHHLINVNYGRDYEGDIVTDIKLIRAGDPCPVCGQPVKFARGIEVGQVFKLGTKYSSALGATYKDEHQEDKEIYMGSYGIGVTRTMAAIVEQHHDDDGIIWPMSVAPYHVIITQMKPGDAVQDEVADRLYTALVEQNIEVLLDDREERPGVKFKDADLIGIPLRITVGRDAAEGLVEYKERARTEVEKLSVEEAIKQAAALVAAGRTGR